MSESRPSNCDPLIELPHPFVSWPAKPFATQPVPPNYVHRFSSHAAIRTDEIVATVNLESLRCFVYGFDYDAQPPAFWAYRVFPSRSRITIAKRLFGTSLVPWELVRHMLLHARYTHKVLRGKTCLELLEAAKSVFPLADPNAFVPASWLWREHFPTYKRFRCWLDRLPEGVIRYRRPRKNRLEIHAGDWTRFWAEQQERSFEALDSEDPPSVVGDVKPQYIEAAQERLAQVRAKKQAEGGSGAP